MPYTCRKGHLHETPEKAERCYICKRRARRRDGRRSAQDLPADQPAVSEAEQTTKEQQNG